VIYTVQDDGNTSVKLAVSLTNTTSKYYTSEYGIRVGFSDIKNVTAFDPEGKITPEVTKNDTGYTIKVRFNQPAVGIDKTLPFTIQFDTPDIVQKEGSIYEVDIPGVANQSDYESFTVEVRVPSFYGEPTYIKPDTKSTSLQFTKEQLKNGGISIAFGKAQFYDISLKYHLQNENIFSVRTEIALPPSTNYQEVSLESIEPKPLNVKQDRDGNWLAEYSLLPSEKRTIMVKGKIRVLLQPNEQKENKQLLESYIRPQKYWQVDDEEIKKLAQDLKTPEAIYAYVVKKLSYDFSRVTERKGRIGALSVLSQPDSAVCLEFTDLFIAIARAAGIPAREINGFGYTQNELQRPLSFEEDILHAWPEYYDNEKNTWIMVDPTWGNTTGGVDYFDVLDFNHITFVIKGTDSTYPVPAGGYKLSGSSASKDVHIQPTDPIDLPLPGAHATIEIPDKLFAGFPVEGVLRINNPHGVLYPQQDVILSSDDIIPSRVELNIPHIPPFGYISVPFSFDKTGIWTQKNAKITVHIGETQISQTVKIVPLYQAIFQRQFLPWTIGGGVCLASIALIIFIITKRSRNISVS